MRRILFVDDESSILQGLQRVLHPYRDQWEMAFAQGGDAALAMLEAAPFDVIVSDMRMPGMDGAALLACVRERYPEIIRVILSGYADRMSAFRAVPVAHQFLGKPCDSSTLRVSVERACGLKALLSDGSLCRMVGALRDLPPLPRVYVALTGTLLNANASLDQIARIVEQDVAIAVKVLQLVNSAFFGLSREVTNIRTAVSHLGLDLLKSLVLYSGIVHSFEEASLARGFSLDDFESHAHLTVKIAEALPTPRHLKDVTSAAALLHDVGKLVLAANMPAHLTRVFALARERGLPIYDIEMELMGVTHAEIGAYLLGLWGLPWPIVEAVAHHHAPARVPGQGLDAVAAVHIANILAIECAPASLAEPGLVRPSLEPAYLDLVGATGQISEWRARAREINEASGSVVNVG